MQYLDVTLRFENFNLNKELMLFEKNEINKNFFNIISFEFFLIDHIKNISQSLKNNKKQQDDLSSDDTIIKIHETNIKENNKILDQYTIDEEWINKYNIDISIE